MTHRERYLATLRGEKVDRIPDLEFGAWDETYPAWHAQGLPVTVTGCDEGIRNWFHTDDEAWGPAPWVDIGLRPGFTTRVLEVRGDHQIMEDGDGATVEMMRPGLGVSIPRHLRYAIETRADWEKIRDERLVIDDPARIPADLAARCAATLTADYPVILTCGSLYGWIRNWMGVERLSETLYEDPSWVEEMMEHLTLLMLKAFEPLGGRCRIDQGNWWEDMCFKTGPLMSPAMVGRLMVPRYRRVADFLRNACGCRYQLVDCDGRIEELAPLWVEAGVNVLFPLESPHTDPYAIRRMLGDRVVLRGGFDKKPLIEGPAAIDQEFARLKPLMDGGRFMPGVDHRVPPDVPLEHYRYYRRRKCDLIGKPYQEGPS